jgi:hypothetical protein
LGKTAFMAFGQQSGPPASARQVRELLTLLQEAGHSDFRDARGPMGFTQRQAAGKFTRDEAEAFVDRLQEASADESPVVAARAPVAPRAPAGRSTPGPSARRSAAETVLRTMPADSLADELRRRGWTVTEP